MSAKANKDKGGLPLSADPDMGGDAMWFRLRGPGALGQAVASCRQAGGSTQEQLAGRLRIHRTTLIDMEAGRGQALARAVEALGLLGFDLIVVPRTARVTVTEAAGADTRPTTPAVGVPQL
jgi:hypothetical protein